MNQVVALASCRPQHALLYRLRTTRDDRVARQTAILAILVSRLPRFKLITAPPPVLLLSDYSVS